MCQVERCSNCPILREQLHRARIVIKHQRRQLNDVRRLAWKIIMQARQVLDKGGQPRGTWSLWKGRGEAAGAIFRIVFTDWAGLVADILGE